MSKTDSELIFEQYFHSFTDVIEEARGRKKQFSERVKQVITDPKTGEKRLESYYEMMQRIKRQQLMQQADAEYEAENQKSPEQTPELGETKPVEGPIEKPIEKPISIEPDEDIDIDVTSKPIEDVGSFNFNATLTSNDLIDAPPKDSMAQDILQYVEDAPATGNDIVNYLIDKGVNETDARNKVASLAMLDVLKLYFSDEEKSVKPGKPSIINLPDLDENDIDGDDSGEDDLDEYVGHLGDLPEPENGEIPLDDDEDLPLSDYSEEELPGDQL